MRTAILGTGRMGRKHITIARGLGLNVVGIADSDQDALQGAARESGLPAEACYTDVRALLAATTPECVIVATTAPTHCEHTCLAAQAGAKYVLCEKPLAVSLAECARMRMVCERHGCALAVNHQMRYMEQYTRPRQLLESPELGGVTSISVVAGNIGLAMNGTHYFEMFRYITAEPPANVTAWLDAVPVANPRGSQFSDRAGQLRVTTARGKRLYIDAGHDQGHGLRVIYAARHGQIEIDELAGTMHVSARRPEHRALPTIRYAMPAVDRVESVAPLDVFAATRSVLDALVNNGDYPDGRVGELAVGSLVAAYISDESCHAAVNVDLASLPQSRTFPWA